MAKAVCLVFGLNLTGTSSDVRLLNDVAFAVDELEDREFVFCHSGGNLGLGIADAENADGLDKHVNVPYRKRMGKHCGRAARERIGAPVTSVHQARAKTA